MSWYLFGQLRPGRSFLDPLPSSNSYIFDFPVGSFLSSLEDIKLVTFLQSSIHLFKYQFSFLYNFLKSIGPEIPIPSYIMAVASPILPFDDVERFGVSDEADSLASLQALVSDSMAHSSSEDRYLVVSPYDEKPHLLDLDTLDTPNQLLARALVGMKCLREDYATAPYFETFNVCVLTCQSKIVIGGSLTFL